MKKFVGLVLAAVMVMAMTVVAFADNTTPGTATGTITVENPKNEETYTAYKIFDVTYSGEAYAYTIDKNSKWLSVVQGYTVGLTLGDTATGDKYNVTMKNTFNASEFAARLKAADKTDKGGQGLTIVNGKATISGLPLGYYFVSSTNGALCNLTTTDPDAVIHDKNDVPFSKTDDKESVELGEVVTYTITGKVPNTTGFREYVYKISDTMSEGLTFNEASLEVKVGTTTLSKDTGYTFTKKNNGFELIIPVKDLQSNVGETITVTYTAKVNENAIAKISKNEATLTYTNNPVESTTTTTEKQEQKVYSAKITIDKYDTAVADKSSKLQDAKFILKNSVNQYYKYNTDTGVIDWVDNKEQADVFITNAKGEASINGLKDGNYKLYEIEAPKGYNLLKDPINIAINGKDGTIINVDKLTVKEEVGNSKGSLLPSTGGIGTTIFYVLGGILVLGAAIVLVTKRRMNEK